jgi:hypothetical protein
MRGDMRDIYWTLKKEDAAMSQTKFQAQSQELLGFVTTLVTRSGKDPTMAIMPLGVRLLQLMRSDTSSEWLEQTNEIYVRGMLFFKEGTYGTTIGRGLDIHPTPITEESVRGYMSELTTQGKEYELAKSGRRANFCRCLAMVCDALLTTKERQPTPIARACVKAWYAGADLEKIKAAAMLLF